MFSKLPAILIILILFACSGDNNNPTYPFERSVLNISVAKRCKDGAITSDANCLIMQWQHPIEKKDLQKYYIWLDTIVVNDSVQNVSQSQINRASDSVAYSGKGDGDSLDLSDLIGEFLERDSLHIAIWAKYSSSEQGAVQHFYVHFGDDIPPSKVYFSDSAAANTIWMEWTRPTDQRDFYSPNEKNGPIAGYNVSIEAENANENISSVKVEASLAGEIVSPSDIKYFSRLRKNGREVMLDNIDRTNTRILRLAILDGKGFDTTASNANNWKMEISGLRPERSYTISMVAFDSAGNSSALESRKISTTDTIPPLIASKFRLYADSCDNLPRLDSNRLILFWLRSIDPSTNPTEIKLDSNNLYIPPNYISGVHYKEVKTYITEQWNGKAWETIPRNSAIPSDYYNYRYKQINSIMVPDSSGDFVSDTLRWILPGDTIILRMRAVDSSGHYSKAWIDTIAVSKGELCKTECPPNYAPVKMGSDVFCMEKLQHISDGAFERNVLYADAKKSCDALGHHLCTEQEWNAACNSRGSNYGVIEETLFSPDEFLYRHCGVGTDDSIFAYNTEKRDKICVSPDGIRDLPGQLQEWVTGASGEKLLKGTGYIKFEGASRVELAQCKNRFAPTRIRPRYTTDTAWLYRSGSRIDTLFERDTLRAYYGILPPDLLPNTILVYELKNLLTGELLGIDYFDLAEYNRRGGEKWLEVFWQGLIYEPKDTLQVLISGKESMDASEFFLDPSVGFRCCAASE